METKLYIRDGKRFKYVPNMVGMYWNGMILTEKKIQDSIAVTDSIAVVIEQHYDHVTMASLRTSSKMNWFAAKEWCLHAFNDVYQGRLPSKTELINLKKYITTAEILTNGINYVIDYIWGEESSNNRAWSLLWSSGSVLNRNKSNDAYVRAIAVIDIPILNLI